MTEEKSDLLNDYIFIKDIGEGNFGKVKLSMLKATKEKFAIKILDKEKLKSQTKSTLFNEIEIISRLNHPNIIYVDKIIEDAKNYYIIMEYCEKGELFDYIVEQERLNPIEASIFFYQIINGVDYIHKQGFSHRDLKPENLLLTKEKIIKIIDFGLCHDFDENKVLKTKCGSPSYAAPEILKGYPYDGFKTDIWCCGIILYAMLCGYLPFDGDDNQEIFQSIVECEPEFPNFLEDDAINLLIWLLNPEPKERITMEEIKMHPFYLKGKSFYALQYEESDDCDDEYKNNEIKNVKSKIINFNYNSVDKKKTIGFSTIRKKKGNIYTFNNIKRLKMKDNKRFKNNIYQNIFNNINNINDEDSAIRKKNNKKKTPYLLTSFNNHNEKNKKKYTNPEKCEKSANNVKNNNTNNNTIGLNDKVNKINQQTEIERIEDMTLTSAEIKNDGGDKIVKNKLQSFIKNNNNNDSYKLKHNANNQKSNKKRYDLNINNINAISLDINKYNQNKYIDNKRVQTINIKNKNSFFNENIIKFKEKNQEKSNNLNLNINDKKGIINDQLDFFQKFIINKNKKNSTEKSPSKKNIEINCNLVLTKKKEKSKKDKEISESKKIMSLKDRIILTQKRKNNDSINDNYINNKITMVKSPAQSINNYYKRNIKKNKIINSIMGYNSNNIIKNEINNGRTAEVNNDRLNLGCHSCSIKRVHRHKNLKIGVNNGLNNLKIINLNTQSNTTNKKDIRNNNFIIKNQNEINNNNLLSLNMVLKTEPKNNYFLDKVIQKINSNNQRKSVKNKMNILLNNGFKNEDNKQMFRFLSIEKNNNNNNDFIGNAFLLKYYKNNKNDEDKVSKISTLQEIKDKDDSKHFLHIINQKIDNNINIKKKSKKVFPNLMIYSKI